MAEAMNDCHEAVEEAENHLQKSELLKLDHNGWKIFIKWRIQGLAGTKEVE